MFKSIKLMIKFLAIILLFQYPFSNLFSQKNLSNNFISPLDIPLFLSGNYGELRTDHFHAGIDIKTQGVKGKPVFVSYDGYVSRIKIQSGGYGNALYITHPNGYTSVYGHLDRFIPSIQDYVERKQYESQKFEIELFPGHDQFMVQQGQIIAYSGNTGRSGGPHLHFEIRKSNGQVPLNVLRFNLPVADNIPPVFVSLYAYNFSEDQLVGNSSDKRRDYQVVKKNDTTYQVDGVVLLSGNYFGLGAEAYDYLNGSANKCGIYTMSFYLDEEFQYGFTIDNISFANTRYINAHMDYELKVNEGKSVHRLYSLPNNRLRIYSHSEDNGIVSLIDDSIHSVRLEAYDVYGNKSILFAKVQKGDKDDEYTQNTAPERVNWFEGGIFQTGPYRVSIPPSSLYNDIYMDLIYMNGNSLLEDTLIIHTPDEPLHKSMTIRVALDSVALQYKEKLILARIDKENEIVSEEGECIDSKLITSTRSFGKYIIIPDTVKPVITPITFFSGKKYTDGQQLKFTVLDELAGLHSYNAYIDDQWIILKYDAKSDTMVYTIDGKRLSSGMNHDLRIEVRDNKGNLAIFTGEFYY
jgi:hypothetical protein